MIHDRIPIGINRYSATRKIILLRLEKEHEGKASRQQCCFQDLIPQDGMLWINIDNSLLFLATRRRPKKRITHKREHW